MPSHLAPLSGTLTASRGNLGETGGRQREKGGDKGGKTRETDSCAKKRRGEEAGEEGEGTKEPKRRKEKSREEKRRKKTGMKRKLRPNHPTKTKHTNTPNKTADILGI